MGNICGGWQFYSNLFRVFQIVPNKFTGQIVGGKQMCILSSAPLKTERQWRWCCSIGSTADKYEDQDDIPNMLCEDCAQNCDSPHIVEVQANKFE